MRFGKIVEQGPVDEIFHDAEEPLRPRAARLDAEARAPGRPRRSPAAEALPEPVLSVRHLTKQFGAKAWTGKTKYAITAVDDASLDLYPGREPRHRRRERLRQDHARPADAARRRADRRADHLPPRRRQRDRRDGPLEARARRLPPPGPPGLPGPLRLAEPAHDGEADHRRSALRHPHRPRRGARAQKVGDLLELVGLERVGDGALPARLLRRPAPAHRHRPRARARPARSSSPTRRPRRSTSRSAPRSSTCCSPCRSGWR